MFETPFTSYFESKNVYFANFGNWRMPVYFTSIKSEYNAVRNDVGLFDVSHMGYIEITGSDSTILASYITTNDIENLEPYKAAYSFICSEDSGILDDIIIYKKSANHYIFIVNAINVDKIYSHLIKHSVNKNVNINNLHHKMLSIAIQGPNSPKIINKMFNRCINIEYFYIEEFVFKGAQVLISRTGYTGEIGFEVWINHEKYPEMFKYIVNFIDENNLRLCGLGARDILRLEAGYPLYNHELSEDINPFQVSGSWAVKLNKLDFIGKEALITLQKPEQKSVLRGFIFDDRALPREGCKIYFNNEEIGFITSGTFSFHLNKPIALGFIKQDILNNPNAVQIKVRDKFITAHITKPKFYDNKLIKSKLEECDDKNCCCR
ncbi:glycine cleavage system aminomethyltransferase GcvT [bacterium]